MIIGITHIGITVSDVERSVRYYGNTFGMKVLSDAERRGEWVEKVTGLSGFHTRTIYLSFTPYLHLELFQFYHPTPVPAEEGTGFRVGIRRCNLNGIAGHMSQDPDGLWMRAGASPGDEAGDHQRPATKSLYPTFLVRDLDASIRFYRDVLGLEITNRTESSIDEILPETRGPGERVCSVLFRTSSGPCLELVQPLNVEVQPPHPWVMQRIGFSHVAFGANHLDRYYPELVSRGLSFKSPPQSLTIGPHGGGRVVYLTAPEDFTLELIDSPLIRKRASHLAKKA